MHASTCQLYIAIDRVLEAAWVTSDRMGVDLASMGDECHSGAVCRTSVIATCASQIVPKNGMYAGMYGSHGIVSVVNGRRGGPMGAREVQETQH